MKNKKNILAICLGIFVFMFIFLMLADGNHDNLQGRFRNPSRTESIKEIERPTAPSFRPEIEDEVLIN